MFRFLLAMPAVLVLAATAHAHHFSSGDLVIGHPWSRPTAPGIPIGVAYLSITNHGPKEDVLIGARTPLAAHVEFHRSTLEAGIARMRPVGTLVIAPNTTVTAAPGGLHLMLVDLNSALVAGTSAPLVLRFKVAGEITVQLRVEEHLDATTPANH
jgi:copper(I)-binding protein